MRKKYRCPFIISADTFHFIFPWICLVHKVMMVYSDVNQAGTKTSCSLVHTVFLIMAALPTNLSEGKYSIPFWIVLIQGVLLQ